MKYIDHRLSEEIRKKLEIFKSEDESKIVLGCRNIRDQKIKESARMNSFRIEYPSTESLSNLIPGPRDRRHFMIKGAKNLENAYNWGRENFNPENLDEFFIRKVAYNVLPEAYVGEVAQYRNSGTRISGASTIPPDPYKVRAIEMPNFVKSLRERFQNDDSVEWVKTAIFAHLHLARIHPFIDGNGRTTRALQDSILGYKEIPVPIVHAGEREMYFTCLDKAVYDWKHKKNSMNINQAATEGEQLFYTFMAGKINISLDSILERCAIHKPMTRRNGDRMPTITHMLH